MSVPNHLSGDDPASVVAADERALVAGRSMLVKRLRPLPVEAVVRGYLAGSGWAEYRRGGTVCGVPLPGGLVNASRLGEPIFTPATKAEAGAHDENIDFAHMQQLVGADLAARVRDVSLRLYREAADFALSRGIIIADTKFEFGLDEAGTLTLMDEILTPDSSRFWPRDGYREGVNPPSFDKQFLRDWLEAAMVDGQPWNKKAPAPALPPQVVRETARALCRGVAHPDGLIDGIAPAHPTGGTHRRDARPGGSGLPACAARRLPGAPGQVRRSAGHRRCDPRASSASGRTPKSRPGSAWSKP